MRSRYVIVPVPAFLIVYIIRWFLVFPADTAMGRLLPCRFPVSLKCSTLRYFALKYSLILSSGIGLVNLRLPQGKGMKRLWPLAAITAFNVRTRYGQNLDNMKWLLPCKVWIDLPYFSYYNKSILDYHIWGGVIMTSTIYVEMVVHTTNFILCCYTAEKDKKIAIVQVQPEYSEIITYTFWRPILTTVIL